MNVTLDIVHQADLIYCMTDEQCRALARQFPQAAGKTVRLDPRQDIADPAGGDPETFLACLEHLQAQILRRLDELGLAPA